MSVRLVRESSETPNITNKDDARMIRYSYGGYNGVVKNFGSELDCSTANGVFTIQSGRVVLDGWEVDLDSVGWELPVSGMNGTQYYSVYLEVNLVTETAQIKSYYSTSSYPSVEKGDDLTEYPSGVSRLLLYTLKVVNGIITEFSKKVEIIPYTLQKVEEIERRLKDLGFNVLPTEHTSTVNVSGASIGTLSVFAGSENHEGSFRQGNFVKLALFLELDYIEYPPGAKQDRFYWYGDQASIDIGLPEKFLPKTPKSIAIPVSVSIFGNRNISFYSSLKLTLNTDGTASLAMSRPLYPGIPSYDSDYLVDLNIDNAVFEVSYESNPINTEEA